jgi:hypothetical protein
MRQTFTLGILLLVVTTASQGLARTGNVTAGDKAASTSTHASH